MLCAPAMANNSFMGQRRRPLMPSFPGSQFRKKNPYFQNVANDPGTAPRAKQVMTLKDRRVLVVYQSDRRARRIILRFDHGHGRIVVVLPKRVTLAQGRQFALLNRGWIRDRLDLLPEAIPFRPGRKDSPFWAKCCASATGRASAAASGARATRSSSPASRSIWRAASRTG